jgi:hypothetical protein
MSSKSRWQRAVDIAKKAKKAMKQGGKMFSIFGSSSKNGLPSNLGQPKVW